MSPRSLEEIFVHLFFGISWPAKRGIGFVKSRPTSFTSFLNLRSNYDMIRNSLY